jgi:hypothetical protein
LNPVWRGVSVEFVWSFCGYDLTYRLPIGRVGGTYPWGRLGPGRAVARLPGLAGTDEEVGCEACPAEAGGTFVSDFPHGQCEPELEGGGKGRAAGMRSGTEGLVSP